MFNPMPTANPFFLAGEIYFHMTTTNVQKHDQKVYNMILSVPQLAIHNYITGNVVRSQETTLSASQLLRKLNVVSKLFV